MPASRAARCTPVSLRIWPSGYTSSSRPGLHTLVWYALHESMQAATQREKQVKAWRYARKLQLIEATNLDWNDLHPDIL